MIKQHDNYVNIFQASLSKNRRLVKSKKLIHGSEDFKEVSITYI